MSDRDYANETFDLPMNKKRKFTHTIRFQFTLIFFLLIAGTVFICWILNSTFLERYYQQKTTQGFKEVYELLQNASVDGNYLGRCGR